MIRQSTLQSIVSAQRAALENAELGMPRDHAQSVFWDAAPQRQIKVITGVRRCGKSTLLAQIRKKHGAGCYFNFEDPRIAGFAAEDFDKLLAALAAEYGRHELFYFDGIHAVRNWGALARLLADSGKRVVATSSNSSLYHESSLDDAAGRHHAATEIFPFSYAEAEKFHNRASSPDSFAEYLERGGFPEYRKSGRLETLHNIFESVIAQDIIARNRIRNATQLRQLGIELFSNIGSEFSYNYLKKSLGIPAIQTVIDNVSYFEDAGLLFVVQKFDRSQGKRIIGPKKVYAVDNGLAKHVSTSFSNEREKLLQNAVYLELRRRHGPGAVFFYRGDKECDFVVCEGGKPVKAVQVACEINQDNEKRETAGLAEAMEKLRLERGTIVTMGQEDRMSIRDKEVEIVPAYKWATEKS